MFKIILAKYSIQITPWLSLHCTDTHRLYTYDEIGRERVANSAIVKKIVLQLKFTYDVTLKYDTVPVAFNSVKKKKVKLFHIFLFNHTLKIFQ